MNKATRGDGIPVELFQILKDDTVKVLHSIWQQIWKTQQWPQDWKGQFSFQSQKRAMSKSVQTTIPLHSFHMLTRLYSKSFKLCFSSTWTENLQMYKLDLEKVEGPANICWVIEKAREIHKYIYFFFTGCTKAFYCVDHHKLWKILKELGIPDHLTCLLRNLFEGQVLLWEQKKFSGY